MASNEFPVLRTARLDLIETQPHHASAMFRLFTDPHVTEYYTVHPFTEVRDLLPVISFFETSFNSGHSIRWAIALRGSEDIIGTIGYHKISSGHKATVLFALMPEHHNKGYVTEALQEIIKYGFDRLQLKRIDAEVMPGNLASEVVLKKAGFMHEGLLRQWMQWGGEHYDMNMYAIVHSGITNKTYL